MINKFYYFIRPLIPRWGQIYIRRLNLWIKRPLYSSKWPIDRSANKMPINWNGWPEKKKFALLLTHDVETADGQIKCEKLAKIEMDLNFRSSFNFVPERYTVSNEIRKFLINNGFEVCVHGLKHDGKLYMTEKIFNERSQKINAYLKEWGSVGFHSPSTHRNLDWLHQLNIEYDQSTFDTDPFEPNPESTQQIFPFWIRNGSVDQGYIELPYTLPQDFTLYVLMKEKNNDIWKKKLDWIVENGGMVLLKTHPDYMRFNGSKKTIDTYPIDYYYDFLIYLKEKYSDLYWHVLPKTLANYFRTQYVFPSFQIKHESI